MVGSATQKQENDTKIDNFFLQKTKISLILDDTLDSVCVCCGGMKLKKKMEKRNFSENGNTFSRHNKMLDFKLL